MVKQPQAPLVEGHMPLVNPRAHSSWSQETADSGAYLSFRVFRRGCCCEEADGVRARLVGQQVLPRRKAGQLPQHRGHQPPDRGWLQPRRSGAIQQLLGREALVPEELAAMHAHMPHLRSRLPRYWTPQPEKVCAGLHLTSMPMKAAPYSFSGFFAGEQRAGNVPKWGRVE